MITEKRHPAAIALTMFYLGGFSLIAQMIFMREMLIAFYGNELSIGTILASWLIGIGIGATVARFAGKLRRVSWMPVFLCLAPGLILPFQVYVIRIVRSIFHVPFGEYASFDVILQSSLFILFPTCFCIGFMFPTACEMISKHKSNGDYAGDAVSRVYRIEALGSMLAGTAMTFLFAPYLSPYRIVLFAGILSFSAAAVLVRCKLFRSLLNLSLLFLMVIFVFYPGFLRSLEDKFVEARWRAFGVTGGLASTELIDSKDTKYQNLAITEMDGQYVLYGNGQVMFVFPDMNSYEHSIHFLMAQKPDAKRVLLLGGNPVGDIPELLKYDLAEIVYVEIDPGVGEMVKRVMPEEYVVVMRSPRVKPIYSDALKFVMEFRYLFDVVVINTPEPSTSAANRFYTVEFYRAIDRILDKGGVVYTSIMSSERMQSAVLDYSASIYKSLKAVFSEVLVTSETRKSFIASHEKSLDGGPGITFDRETLYERSKMSNVSTKYFLPEYFLGLDAIEPWKIEKVIKRFEKAEVKENTLKRPVAYFYNLIIWNTFSESGLKSLMSSIQKFTRKGISRSVLAFGFVTILLGVVLKRTSPGCMGLWSRWMVLLILMSTGFCGMALEIILVFVFQSLYGYVYTRMGLIVAVFMLGLVFGARFGRSFLACKRCSSLFVMIVLEIVFLGIIAFVPKILVLATDVLAADKVLGSGEIEILIHVTVLFAGLVVGAQFPVANAMMVEAGGNIGSSASSADAADHIGAALGALAAGICLVPVIGVEGACSVLFSCVISAIMLLYSSMISRPG